MYYIYVNQKFFIDSLIQVSVFTEVERKLVVKQLLIGAKFMKTLAANWLRKIASEFVEWELKEIRLLEINESFLFIYLYEISNKVPRQWAFDYIFLFNLRWPRDKTGP